MKRTAIFLMFAFVVLPWAAGAQQVDPTQQALVRAQTLLRQLAQDKAAADAELVKLRAENAQLKKGAKAAESALAERTADLESATRETSGVKGRLTRTTGRLERVTGQLREVVAKYQDKAATLRQTEAERAELDAQLAATRRQLEDAEEKNLALYEINKDMLTRFAQEGPWDGLLRKEPFSGLKGVEIENLVQDYEYEMGEHLRESTLQQLATPNAK
ncbi:MAG: hypothetical protein AB7I32_07130 [Gammaproteobacteria bacterium]